MIFRTTWTIALTMAVTFAPAGALAQTGTFQIDTQFVTGLTTPTAMAFTPDGRIFVTEQTGAVRVIGNDGQLLAAPLFTAPSIRSDGERGLLGIALDPSFESNGYVYLFYTPTSPSQTSRLSRITVSGNQAVSGSELTLLEYANSYSNHRGGEIHFGTDGKLYVALGDAGVPGDAQSVTSYNGKILRFNKDGSIPPDNPTSFTSTSGATLTPSGAYRAIWAIGLRNPFRFGVDEVSGRLYINDVSGSSYEEVNVGEGGRNYGWPTCEGTCSAPLVSSPAYRYPRNGNGCAITGGTFYNGSQFPSAVRGSYFIIDYCNTWLRYVTPTNTVGTIPVAVPNSSVGLTAGPDGNLYVIGHGSGTISRITYAATGTNRNPVAQFTATPGSGTAPLIVTFNGSASSDPDGDAITYLWTFGDGSTGSGATTTHTYSASGTYVARLTVSDGRGGSATQQTSITVGSPPSATINTPAQGTLYTAGVAVNFSGQATSGGSPLPASAFSWTVLFHHDTHTHPAYGPIAGVTSGSFTPEPLGHPEDNVFYRIYLTVTDGAGVQTHVTRDVMPRKATVTVTSNVAGTQVLLDGSPRVTPFSFVGVAGVQRTVEVVSPQTIGGAAYQFSQWSNGGAAMQTIATPAQNTTYTVTMTPALAPPSPPTGVRIIR